ncbi:MAG: hypothetical protein H6644_17325 [Caldilineaceae bacterium]|nr:hypothetical protein [Caldilineaceae bacterium]
MRAVLALKAQQVEDIAVCFLHAYANLAHERRVADLVTELFLAPRSASRRTLCASGASSSARRPRCSTPTPSRRCSLLSALDRRFAGGGFRQRSTSCSRPAARPPAAHCQDAPSAPSCRDRRAASSARPRWKRRWICRHRLGRRGRHHL